jgi:FkbM family methyltransferase
VPTVLLPHFHVEDRYYHWRSFYSAFRDADQVIVNSSFVKEAFMEKIGACSTALPGGGVELDEFNEGNLERCAGEFRKIHSSSKPFVLVLGRKAGGKRYSLVVEAVLGQDDFDLVMVGPDEDGLPLNAPNVHYYGARPREFVIGALRECLCLVNMSESESFGIVLLEAWASGRPVIVQRRCAAFRDLVKDGHNGFLAETVDEILSMARRYLHHPDTARTHAENGLQLARSFAWSAVAEAVHGVVSTVVKGEAPPEPPPEPVFDAADFAREALQETLNLASGELMHDDDFDAFREWCGPRVQCILDIGANRGQSIVGLHRAFPDARIHSFEANPLYHPLLAEVVSRLGVDGVIHPYGLGDRNGELSLYVPWAGGRPWLEESSTLRENFEKPWVAERFAQRGGLTLQPLVASIRCGDELELEPQVVKIDVEGAESLVIRGLEKTLRRCRPVLLVENSDYKQVTRLLAEWDFHPHRWDAVARRLVPFHGEPVNTFYVHASMPLPIGGMRQREGASA